MQRELTIATISWINRTPNPITTAVEASALTPDWIPKTCLGLAATSNPDPGASVADANQFRSGREFRAMSFTKIGFISDARGAITSFADIQTWQDPGWTPPFRQSRFPLTFLAPDTAVWSWSWYPGEISPLSKVCHKVRHPNSVITGVPANETVLVNALIKFRAGKHTDDVGIKNVGCGTRCWSRSREVSSSSMAAARNFRRTAGMSTARASAWLPRSPTPASPRSR
jgi:hypothetical protein